MRRFLYAALLAALPAAGQPSPQQPTFRTTTELVQVSVVAQDKDGKAVTDLRADDFQVFDNGAQEKIALFLAPKSAPERETPRPVGLTIPSGAFTNQLATQGSAGYSVLLFDNLNIDGGQNAVTYTARARQKALQALSAIPPGDKVAIYALWCQFQVFREFTSDRDSLIQQLGRFALAPANCVDSGNGPEHALTQPDFNPGFAPPMVNPAGAPPIVSHSDGGSAAASAIQADIADREIQQLAEHLAGIPGRKNLIWLTTTFRLKPGNLQKLINANVAIYPVDTIGSMVALASQKQARFAPIRALAAITGGVAYVDRDDLDVAIADALNDGRLTYLLGFYQPEGDGGAPVHQLAIRVSRPGLMLRYRKSYAIEPPPPASADPVHDLIQAMNRPVAATAIPISVSATRTEDQLDLSVSFDISGMDFQFSDELWKGNAEVLTRFLTAEGIQSGDTAATALTFTLRPSSYASLLEKGAQYHKMIAIPAKAVELDILVGSLSTGKFGTLTIPLSEVGYSAATQK